jgi:DNA-binding GntR family transcriptional regulator
MADRDASVTNAVRVQAELREAILAGSLPPGARLRAEPLAERLRTSRTPVREALILLAREGLVDIEPRRGAIVRSFDAADLADLYDVRALIEPYAARRAATRIGAPDVARLTDLCDRADGRGAADDAAVEDKVAWNEEFHGIVVACARSGPPSGTTTPSASSRSSATARSSTRSSTASRGSPRP